MGVVWSRVPKYNVNGRIFFAFKASRTEWSFVAFLKVKWLLKFHAVAELDLPFQVVLFRLKLAVLLDEVHDSGVEVEDPFLQFEILDLVYRAGQIFCVVDDAHAAIVAFREDEAKGGIFVYLACAFDSPFWRLWRIQFP